MGYGCHPETSQGIIARKRLGERLLKREMYVQVRRAICTERTRRKTPKQIHSVSGTHNLDAPETGATNFSVEDRVFHRLRRQLTRFAASEYVLHRRRVRFRRRPLSACFPGRAYEISPSIPPMSLLHPRPPRKVFIAFPLFACRAHDVCCLLEPFLDGHKAKDEAGPSKEALICARVRLTPLVTYAL